MARFRTVSAVYIDAMGLLSAGRTCADCQAYAQLGDVIWTGLTSTSLPQGFMPLDQPAIEMRSQSVWANTPLCGKVLSGSDSIG
jgi:hypothetical protein